MYDKKVSIIIPAYNAEAYIQRTILSAVNQTYTNIEIIVVNDGSTDRTEEIIKSITDDRIKLISINNSGVSKARNIALNASSGDYVVFLDSDDALTSDAVEYMVNKSMEYNSDICICWQYRLSVGDEPISISQDDTNKTHLIPKEKTISYAIAGHAISVSCLANIYKRDLIKDIRFIEGKNINEDTYFNFLCFCKQPSIVVTSCKVYNYFCTPNSLSRSSFSDKFLDILFYADKKEEIIRQSFPEHIDKIPTLQIKAKMALLHNLCKSYNKKYRVYEKDCIQYIIKNRRLFHSSKKSEIKFIKVLTFRMYWAYKLWLQIKKKFKKI